jgi:hypothetical protein
MCAAALANSALALDSSSSVRCSGHSVSDRQCTFKNLCYSSFTQRFLFFKSEKSVVQGIEEPLNSNNIVRLVGQLILYRDSL